MISQMIELNPPDLAPPLLLQPQLVADKSLIVYFPPKGLFMVYHMYHGLYVFPKNKKIFMNVQFLAVMTQK